MLDVIAEMDLHIYSCVEYFIKKSYIYIYIHAVIHVFGYVHMIYI